MASDPQDDDPTASSPHGWGLLRRWFGRPSPSPPSEESPERLGRYRVIGLLGEGGMGRVYVAEDETLVRKVALKTLKRADESSRKRFIREARAAARVSHPNLCPIFEVAEEGGQPFLAMELLSGETLSTRLRRGPLEPEQALELANDLLSGLGALHEAGLIHRDVKPSNLFLTPHGVKLVDFGLAREFRKGSPESPWTPTDLTAPGLIVGTPGYMAPEQILGHTVDARADLFAAAVVLYQALTGRKPFPGDTPAGVLSGILYEDPGAIVGSPLLVALDAPLRKALAKKPDDRHASARAMAEALRAAARAVKVAPGSPREAFVGRDCELAWLEQRFEEAAAGAGSVVFVTGERGVGKSALVGEFMRRVRSGARLVTVVAGRCSESHGPAEAFLPFLDAVGRLLTSPAHDRASEFLRTYAPTICVQLPAGLLPDPDGALRRHTAGATKERLIREAGDFMEAACREFPILLFVEDLQWADPASVDLLHHVGCRLVRQRFLVIGSYRQADVDGSNPRLRRCAVDLLARGAARELALGALTPDDLTAYLEARFPGHQFPPALASALHARTEGLALFVRSLVDILVERGDVVRGDGGWVLARPVEELDLERSKGLQDLVRQQLEGLTAREREILEVASVVSREFLSPVVADLVGRDAREVEEDLHRLGRVRRLIVERGEEALPDGTLATRYQFAHALYRSTLRDDLVPTRRLQLHGAAAQSLLRRWGTEAPRIATAIARHCEEGHDHEAALTFRAHAGDNAARLFAYAEAEEHYDWAFRSFERLPAASRPAAAISLHRRRGTVRLAQARFDDATADFEALLAVARATSASVAERTALAGLCDTLFFARRVEEMTARARELLEVASRAGVDAGVDEARARIGQALVCEGRLAEAVPLLDDAIASARRRGLRVALQVGLSYRGLAHYWQTEYQPAEVASLEAASIAAQLGDGFYALASRMFAGLARANLGRISEALDDFADTIALARRNDDRYWLPRLVSHLGWLHRELGALERAREYDTEALQLAREKPVSWAPESEALLNLCVDDVRVGHAERASTLLAELHAKATENAWFRWMNELRLEAVSGEHWAARGDHERANAHAVRLAELARELQARNFSCFAERIQGESALALGDGVERVERRLAAALAGLGEWPAPIETWKSARVLALLRRRLGDEPGARAAFAEAAEAIRVIASGVRDAALRQSFLSSPGVREVLEALPEGETGVRS